MEKDGLTKSSETSIEKEGFISQSLSQDGIPNQSLPDDHIGIENISVEPNKLYEAVSALRNYGFNYLQCQGGYDEGPGKNLVSFYHFITVDDLEKIEKIKEVRLKVILKRENRYELAQKCFTTISVHADLDIVKFSNIFEH